MSMKCRCHHHCRQLSSVYQCLPCQRCTYKQESHATFVLSPFPATPWRYKQHFPQLGIVPNIPVCSEQARCTDTEVGNEKNSNHLFFSDGPSKYLARSAWRGRDNTFTRRSTALFTSLLPLLPCSISGVTLNNCSSGISPAYSSSYCNVVASAVKVLVCGIDFTRTN